MKRNTKNFIRCFCPQAHGSHGNGKEIKNLNDTEMD